MKKTLFIVSILLLTIAHQGQAAKKRKTTVEDFAGTWKSERIHNSEDSTENLTFCTFELYLVKDAAGINSLKGWHYMVCGNKRRDVVAGYHEPSLRGYLKNDTVYLHFISAFGGEGEAKLYFDNSDQNRANIIWKLDTYEYDFFEYDYGRDDVMPRIDTLQKIIPWDIFQEG